MSINRDALTGTADFRHPDVVRYTEQYMNTVLQAGRIAVVFGDVVDLKRLNETEGTQFADKVLSHVGMGLGFRHMEHDELYRIPAAPAERRRQGRIRSESEPDRPRTPDLWVRKGGDEFVGILPIKQGEDPRSVVSAVLSRTERAIAFSLQEDGDPRLQWLEKFPLRFGFSTYEQEAEVSSIGELIAPSDTAVNLAKLLGKIRKGNRGDETVHVEYGREDTMDHEDMNVAVTRGRADFIHVSPDIAHYGNWFPNSDVRSHDFGNESALGAIKKVIRVKRPDREEAEFFLGLRYRIPFGEHNEWAPDLVWVNQEVYHPDQLHALGMSAPSRRDARDFTRNLAIASA